MNYIITALKYFRNGKLCYFYITANCTYYFQFYFQLDFASQFSSQECMVEFYKLSVDKYQKYVHSTGKHLIVSVNYENPFKYYFTIQF